ncbi:MAG TPA: hypothetical protein VN363_06085 [Anaerolineales bacterium]|nr:hypothetical protein [Anaerolineales bacterium]
MERTVPTTESESIDLYQRTYYSLLRSTSEVRIRTLEEVHAGMNSLLHPAARAPEPDMSAFIYSLLRLPPEINDTRLVVMGQGKAVFTATGFRNVQEWQLVSASARRRRYYFDGTDILACVIASRSDIDDLIPMLIAYQLEWNKIHQRLQRLPENSHVAELCNTAEGYQMVLDVLNIPEEDLDRLSVIWDENFASNLEKIQQTSRDLRVRLLSSSLTEYRRATRAWWDQIVKTLPSLRERPVYFVSSNTHSILNLLTSHAISNQEQILHYLKRSGNKGLLGEWQDIQSGRSTTDANNFLYYVQKKYQQTPEGIHQTQTQVLNEQDCGILRIPSENFFDVEAQLVDLSRLGCAHLDPRLQFPDAPNAGDLFSTSQALILNVDYPLGLGAYQILSEIAETVGSILGIYVMGKAATLNAVAGDVMIPNVVHDEHSRNTYLFANCISAGDVTPYISIGTVLDNQKAVTVQGTFLQNTRYMDVFYSEGYTDIEMEAGPYLSAVYEMFRPQRHPVNEIVNLYGLGFDLGIIHYASDTPLSKGKNLGARSLSYSGMDATYASSIAILNRIFKMEQERLFHLTNYRTTA